MPLRAGKSDKNFSANVKGLCDSGMPLNESLETAYSKKQAHTKAYNKRDRAISAKKKK